MQYVRSLGGSVSKTWNSINPATLSGAIDVIVVEQEDGSLACSPFHVRFGKFSLLRPYEKKVEFKVNGEKKDYAMKLGEGGEAFFVFETFEDIPESLQTSPVISPASSPGSLLSTASTPHANLQEPEYLDLNGQVIRERRSSSALQSSPPTPKFSATRSDIGPYRSSINISPSLSALEDDSETRQDSPEQKAAQFGKPAHLDRSTSDDFFSRSGSHLANSQGSPTTPALGTSFQTDRSTSPPPLSEGDAIIRAKSLSKKLSGSNIPTHLADNGDLMLDMHGYKSTEEEALRAEVVARKILSEELEGNYDIGALIGADERGNVWIYSSEEAKDAAARKIGLRGLVQQAAVDDAASDPGYHSDEERQSETLRVESKHQRAQSDAAPAPMRPGSRDSNAPEINDSSRNFAKTLRLTSDQLKALDLRPGANAMSFSVNRATCQANMFYWKYDVPIVISDIDGTITKSDALGHVLNMIGRDWTHLGVAKLYTDIVANGYNIFYLTSRSVGQADTTRTYLNGVVQEGYKLPKGPVIMSPDRTMAALRREIYLRQPEVFKMACLRDILGLFAGNSNPFYAGFGNRLTDALSYRSVNIPRTRIFTINSNAEVSLDLLTLNTYKSSYVTMREVIDHFFPPVALLVKGGGEEFTDFNYWRDAPEEVEDLTDSDEDDGDIDSISTSRKSPKVRGGTSLRSEDEGSDGENEDDEDDEEEVEDEMADSFLSQEESEAGGTTLMDSVLESVENEEDIVLRTSSGQLVGVEGVEIDVGVVAPAPSSGDADVR